MDHDNCLEVHCAWVILAVQDDNMQQMILRLSRAFGLPNKELDHSEGVNKLVEKIPVQLTSYLTVLYPQVRYNLFLETP